MSAPAFGVLVFDGDANLQHVDAEAASVLGDSRAALFDGTADVLRSPISTADGGSYESLPVFVNDLLAHAESFDTVSLANEPWDEARVTYGPDGPNGVSVTVQVSERTRRHERRLQSTQKHLLEQIATGNPLGEVLRDLVLFIEEERPGMLGSVLLLDPDAQTLHHGAAPSLPEDYREVIEGVSVGPATGSCGAAAFHDDVVIAEDIRTDDHWDEYRDVALRNDLRACWSVPIHGEGGETLGTFALYYDDPCSPDAYDRRLIEEASHLASIAIEHDRRKRELQIQKSQFRRLVENAQPIIFLLDADGTLLVSEGDDLSALGVEPGEHEGTSVFELYADYPAMLDYIEQALSGHTVDDVIEMGDVVFDVWYAPYYNRAGAVAGCIGMAVDITERREAEAALRANRDLLRRTQKMAGVGGWEYDPAADAMVGTEETYRIYEVSPNDELSLDESLTFYPEETASAFRNAARRCLQRGEPFEVEGPMMTPEGTFRWVRVQGEARRTNRGSVKMVGTVLDLTERHEIEERLREQKDWLRSITENISGGIYRSTKDGLVYANQAFLDLFGYDDLEEMAAANPRSFFVNPDVRAELLQREEAQGGLDGVEVEYRRKDGSTFIGLLRSTQVTDEQGRTKYFDGVVTDISEQKAREQQLKEAKQEAEEASRLKSALLANMSHEIRTPLTSIIGFAGVLRENLSGEHARYADLAHRSGERLMETLDSVLQLSKLEAGVTTPTSKTMDLVSTAREAVHLHRPQAESAHVTLHFEAPVDELVGTWAPTAIQRILSNLLGNALKFTPEGGAVTVRVAVADGTALLSVSDTGIGISDSFQSRLFDAFTQESEGLKREHEGSGLGLAIVSRLVELVDGEIDVESTKGEGACFTVRLPLS